MLKKNWYLFTPLAIVGLPALILAYYIVGFGYPVNEAIEATTHFLQSQTRYAMKYSDTNFARIQPGMRGDQVFQLVGVPFERLNNDAEWIYALPQGNTKYYHERKVLFDRDKNQVPHVKETVRGFHSD
jgi:hypothetical protein